MSEINWSAWEVDEDLPESFADDVLDAVARGDIPDLPRAADEAAPQQRTNDTRGRRRALGTVGALLAAAAVAVLWWGTRPASPSGAERPDHVSSRQAVTARADTDDAAWRLGELVDERHLAEQMRGRVRWIAPPDTTLVIETPAGRVTSTDAELLLEVIPMPISRRHKLAATAIAGSVAAFVVVQRGEARLDNAPGQLEVKAPEQAVMSDVAPPVVVDPESPPTQLGSATPPTSWAHARAEIERAVEEHRGQEDAPPRVPAEATLSGEYVRETLKAELVPLARECYVQLLEQQPEAAGRVILEFDVMGDASVGGIVDAMEFAEGSAIDDVTFRECVRESMMSAIFDPPSSAGVVHVKYPLVFSTGEDKPIIGRTRIRHARPTIEPRP